MRFCCRKAELHFPPLPLPSSISLYNGEQFSHQFSQRILNPSSRISFLHTPLHIPLYLNSCQISILLNSPISLVQAIILVTTLQPFDGSPGLYAYALIFSAIIVALLAIFTSIDTQPKYYKVSALV